MPAREVLPFVGDWAVSLEGLWLSERLDVVHVHGWLGGLVAQLVAQTATYPDDPNFLGI
ncbi:glycosyltransferase family 1 protein [Mycobacterium uberis]|uniref:glycosyltransferase family 1 protein n=1 Tax=Mycobacterium uberis TaxID=2162698 RepID=UPI001402E670|nr:glycosyltransferase family 1 protein [Mycobacterium uberis]